MSYPNNAPNMWGRENPDQYRSYIDLSTGMSLDAPLQGGHQFSFGYDVVGPGVVMPNYHLMEDHRRAMLGLQQQLPSEYANAYRNGFLETERAEYRSERAEAIRKHDDYCRQGEEQFGKGGFALAVRYFNQALHAIASPKALTNKSAALVGLKKWPEALMAADSAIEADPYGCLAYNNKAIALAAIGQSEDALAQYDNHAIPNTNRSMLYGVRLDVRGSVITCNNASVLLITMGRHAKALDSLCQAEEHGGQYLEVYNNGGVVFTELSDYHNPRGARRARNAMQTAESCFDRALQLSPDNSTVAINKADLWIRHSQYSRAQQVLNQILKRDPDSRVLQEAYLADAFVRNRQFPSAIRLLRRMLDTFPAQREVLEHKLLAVYGSQKSPDFAKYGTSIRKKRSDSRLMYMVALDNSTMTEYYYDAIYSRNMAKLFEEARKERYHKPSHE